VTFVLDASVALAWWFADEPPPATTVLARLGEDNAVTPAIWPAEFANGLIQAQRRGRLAESRLARAVELTLRLPIQVEPAAPARTLGSVLRLALQYSLSAYDAEYLEVALRRGLPLATLDKELRSAAAEAGVELLI